MSLSKTPGTGRPTIVDHQNGGKLGHDTPFLSHDYEPTSICEIEKQQTKTLALCKSMAKSKLSIKTPYSLQPVWISCWINLGHVSSWLTKSHKWCCRLGFGLKKTPVSNNWYIDWLDSYRIFSKIFSDIFQFASAIYLFKSWWNRATPQAVALGTGGVLVARGVPETQWLTSEANCYQRIEGIRNISWNITSITGKHMDTFFE